jgi:hypothetical protein
MKNLIDFPNYPADSNKLKAYHELDCPDMDNIKKEVMHWIDKNTNFRTMSNDRSFWHLIDGPNMARHCPTLIKYMKSIQIPLQQISIGILTEDMKDTGFRLHVGPPPKLIKINFPIFNTENIYTEWYDIPAEDMDALGVTVNPFITSYEEYGYNLWKIHNTVDKTYPCIAKYSMDKNPIVFNSWFPHRVMPGPGAKFPRIMMACMPINDIKGLEYLKKL